MKHFFFQRRARRGFTVVELLVIIAVLGITAAVVIPRIGSANTSKLNAAAMMFAADLQVAQSESMAHPDGLYVMVFHVGDGSGYDLALAADPSTPVTHPMTKSDYTLRWGEELAEHLDGVYLAASNLGAAGQLDFEKYGNVDLTYTPQLVLAAGDHTLTLTLDPDTGTVTIASAYGNAADVPTLTLAGPLSELVRYVP